MIHIRNFKRESLPKINPKIDGFGFDIFNTLPLDAIIFDCFKIASKNKCCNQMHFYMDEASQSFSKYKNDALTIVNSLDQLPVNADTHLLISDGYYISVPEKDAFESVIQSSRADIVFINIKKELNAFQENFRFTSNGKIAGCRRTYCDVSRVALISQWPNYIFIRNPKDKDLISKILDDDNFNNLLDALSDNDLTTESIDMGGLLFDLRLKKDVLSLVSARLKNTDFSIEHYESKFTMGNHSRVLNEVLVADNASIADDVTLIGPSVICENAVISDKAIICNSIVGPKVKIKSKECIRDKFLVSDTFEYDIFDSSIHDRTERLFNQRLFPSELNTNSSYAGCVKRLADIIASVLVLILCLPLFPIIALGIKLTDPGPIFYKAKRQGLGGKFFGCLKFRTMMVGADDMQELLRDVNEIDGPQFKMEDDPRVSTIGKFLRDTCLDEIPQFINVLKGQMSVVGPRPSPESENTQCPAWRDARLSVRPGITGPWQVWRTREPDKDFQEWIYHDTSYAQKVCLKLDLLICWKTFIYMLTVLLRKF